jgi:hypothetical protein
MSFGIFIQRFSHGIAATENNAPMASPLRRTRRARHGRRRIGRRHVSAGQGPADAIARAATDSTIFGERNTRRIG